MKFKILALLSLLIVVGCASGPETKMGSSDGDKSEKSDDLQDVKTVDKTYSEDVKFSSNLKKSRARFSCEKHVEIEKTNWKDLVEAGYSCLQDKNWAALSEIASKISHNHLKAPWGPYYRSIVSEHRGDFARAIWMADLALKKAPENPMILFQKARILWHTKNESEAFELMKKVVKLDKENYDALLFLGNIHYRDREFKEALSYYDKVLKYNSKDSEYRAAMAESNFYLGKYQDSIKHYKAAAAGQEKNASLYFKIGLAYKNLKDWTSSKSYLEKAIAQRRKGRSIASLSDEKMRTELNVVLAKIEEMKGDNKDQKVEEKAEEKRNEE